MKLVSKIGPLLIPIVVLGGAAGTGLVVAAEPDTPKPNGDRAFAAAPASLVTANPSGSKLGTSAPQSSSSSSTTARKAATSLKKKKKKKKGKKGKQITLRQAKSASINVARRSYRRNRGGKNWDDYGLSRCKRLGRKAISCGVFVTEEAGGYNYDDYVCEWVVKSSLGKRKKVRVADGWNRRDCG